MNISPPVSWTPIHPQSSSALSQAPTTHAAPVSRSVLRDKAYDLLQKYCHRSISRSGAPLPTRDELARTSLERDPGNRQRAVIIFFDENGNHLRYCFLNAQPEKLDDLKSCADEYRDMLNSQSLELPVSEGREAQFIQPRNCLQSLPNEILSQIFSEMNPKEAVGAYAANKQLQQVLMKKINIGKAEWFKENCFANVFFHDKPSRANLVRFDKLVAILLDRRNPEISDADRSEFLRNIARSARDIGQARITDCFKVGECIEDSEEIKNAVEELVSITHVLPERVIDNAVRILKLALSNRSGLERASSIVFFVSFFSNAHDPSFDSNEKAKILQGILQLSDGLGEEAELRKAIFAYEEVISFLEPEDSQIMNVLNNRIQQLQLSLTLV